MWFQATTGKAERYVSHYSGTWVAPLVIPLFLVLFFKGLICRKEKRKTIWIEREEEKLILFRKVTPITDFMFNGTTNKKISNNKSLESIIENL